MKTSTIIEIINQYGFATMLLSVWDGLYILYTNM